MLKMTCDRCGEEIPHDETRDGKAGRDRWRFSGRDVIVDLCPLCAGIVRSQWLQIIEGWANPAPLEVRS